MQGFTRRCDMCHKHRDADDLFDGDGIICLLCVRREGRKCEGKLHVSQRQIEARQRRPKQTPAERYRNQLVSAGYLPEQINRYVAARFPERGNDIMNTVPTCAECGWHRFANDRNCDGCARLDAQEREAEQAIEKPGDRYVRIVNGRRTYSSAPHPGSIHDPRVNKRQLRRQNHG